MLKPKKNPLGMKLAEFFEIPLDTAIDWPRVVLTGNKNAVIYNHRGVIEYDQTTIRVNTKLGEVHISGTGLTLVSALKEEIIVEGKIDGVRLVDWR